MFRDTYKGERSGHTLLKIVFLKNYVLLKTNYFVVENHTKNFLFISRFEILVEGSLYALRHIFKIQFLPRSKIKFLWTLEFKINKNDRHLLV